MPLVTHSPATDKWTVSVEKNNLTSACEKNVFAKRVLFIDNEDPNTRSGDASSFLIIKLILVLTACIAYYSVNVLLPAIHCTC